MLGQKQLSSRGEIVVDLSENKPLMDDNGKQNGLK